MLNNRASKIKYAHIDAGIFDRRIELQNMTLVPDEYGTATETWQTYATVWACLYPVSPNRFAESNRAVTETFYDVYIRYRRGVAAGNRAVHGTRTFLIEGVYNVDERNIVLRLYCVEEK